MFLKLSDNFGTIGTIIVIILILGPYLFFRYAETHKSKDKIAKEKSKYNFIGSFQFKFSNVRGSRWVKEVTQLIMRERSCYPEFDLKTKIVTVHYEQEIDKKGLRNLLIKIGYVVEIVASEA